MLQLRKAHTLTNWPSWTDVIRFAPEGPGSIPQLVLCETSCGRSGIGKGSSPSTIFQYSHVSIMPPMVHRHTSLVTLSETAFKHKKWTNDAVCGNLSWLETRFIVFTQGAVICYHPFGQCRHLVGLLGRQIGRQHQHKANGKRRHISVCVCVCVCAWRGCTIC